MILNISLGRYITNRFNICFWHKTAFQFVIIFTVRDYSAVSLHGIWFAGKY